MYAVGIETLRPGWTWRSSKWVGRWQPPRKAAAEAEGGGGKKPAAVREDAAGRAAFARLQTLWPKGGKVPTLTLTPTLHHLHLAHVNT